MRGTASLVRLALAAFALATAGCSVCCTEGDPTPAPPKHVTGADPWSDARCEQCPDGVCRPRR